MIGQETHVVERKTTAILKILSNAAEPLGGRVISRRLKEQGIYLSERTVRYHLKIMDERGLTHIIGHRDGRAITEPGLEELRNVLVYDRIGFLTDKIELLAYQTTLDLDTYTGNIPIDVSLFPEREFTKALESMKDVFAAGLCVSNLVTVASENENLGGTIIPQGKIGFATVCNIATIGSLLKAGIPVDSRFGGIVQLHNYEPLRFIDLIEYGGSTLSTPEIFIASKMTNVTAAVRNGEGKVLASFHEIPAFSGSAAKAIIEKLKAANLCNLALMGKTNESLCEIPVRANKFGLVLLDGLNPISAASESGIEVSSKAMIGVIDFGRLRDFKNQL